jgi:hypothetical protein
MPGGKMGAMDDRDHSDKVKTEYLDLKAADAGRSAEKV